MANLINVMCALTALLTSYSSISLPLLGPPCFLRHNNEIRPINNPTVGSKSVQVKGRVDGGSKHHCCLILRNDHPQPQ